MREITIDAHAKINLALDVVGKLPNGYHEVRMIMQQLELKDRITVKRKDYGKQRISVTCTNPAVPCDGTNLAWRAAELMLNLQEILEGVEIHIEKNIPMEAGLAGGSTDCAAVMMAMNTLFDMNLKQEFLLGLGAELGADVPFCIQGGTALATGTGTAITDIRGMNRDHYTLVLCKPDFGVSTAAVYKRYSARMEEMKIRKHPDIVSLIGGLESGASVREMKRDMVNVLEYVTGELHPEIGQIENIMEANGADVAMMTGSGPTVFGIFRDKRAAAAAYVALAERYRETYITVFR